MRKIQSSTIKLTKNISPILKIYFRELRKNDEQLSKDEELHLLREYKKTKNERIKQRIITNNLRFVLTVVKYYDNSKTYTLEDLISSGNIGLIKAIDDFDPERNLKFITYANWWIRQEIFNGLYNHGKMIRHNSQIHSLNVRYIFERDSFFAANGFEPNIEDIIDNIIEPNATNRESMIKALISINDNNIVSMDTPINDDLDSLNLHDIIGSDDNIDDNKLNTPNINKLTKLEKVIVKYTYGFNELPELSVGQISKELSLQPNEVENILCNALKKLKYDIQCFK